MYHLFRNKIFFLIFFNFFLTLVTTFENNNSIYLPFSESETVAIKNFRKIVGPYLYQDYMNSDQYLIRWIKDSDFDLNAAKQKLLKAIEWRKQNNIDTILQEDFSSFFKQCPFTSKEHDKIGRPITTMSVGTCDLRKILIAGDLARFQRYLYYFLELCASRVREIYKSGKDVRDTIMIFDVNGFNLRQHGCLACLPGIFALIETYESYYPYYTHRAFGINVPRIVLRLVDIILPALSTRTKEIYKIFGHDRAEWEAEIRNLIEPDKLPYQFGGIKQKKFTKIVF